ncbi:MAG: NAD(P)-dependent dehydrogenase (short-subunit alcohol dehydrogenase family) [Motiliproteus sp.]|jgi:NAD(P)-dependent dehydrogenase (short-subunit alcohol dehydrogenase family)
MQKTILITGSTDGIGLATAQLLVSQGHRVLLHGRSTAKLQQVAASLVGLAGEGSIERYQADLSNLAEVEALAKAIADKHSRLDVLINNAGVLRAPDTRTAEGLDVRFVVNTLAPYLLTQRLLPLLGTSGRVVNVSSAAQAPVDLQALAGKVVLADDFNAYAQSKLALTAWSRYWALSLASQGPILIAVNPGSMLGSKMVREGFGVEGADLSIGAEVLVRAALAAAFANASGQYFDNDSGQFAAPHTDALDPQKTAELVRTIERVLLKIA